MHDLRLLAHGAGDEHHLPFAAGYLGVAFAGQVFDAQLAHDLIGEFRVLTGGGAQQTQMRRAAHAHYLQRGIGKGRAVFLIDEGNRERE